MRRQARDVKLSEVFITLEGPMGAVECREHPEFCSRCTECVTRDVWAQMQSAIMGVLESMTLQDLVDKAKLGQAENYQI